MGERKQIQIVEPPRSPALRGRHPFSQRRSLPLRSGLALVASPKRQNHRLNPSLASFITVKIHELDLRDPEHQLEL